MKKIISDIIFIAISAMVIVISMMAAQNMAFNFIIYVIPLIIILAIMTFTPKRS